MPVTPLDSFYDSAADNDYIYMVGVKADADATKQNNGAALSSVDWTLLRLEIASDGSARSSSTMPWWEPRWIMLLLHRRC